MSDDEKTVECGTHGDAYATFICGHLGENPRQKWFCDYPAEDNHWPDAWCSACDEAFQREGEWNEKNEQGVDLKLLCHCCYEESKGSSVGPLMEARSGTWQPLLSEATSEMQAKQDTLSEKFGLGRHDRWDWDQDTGMIVFSDADLPSLEARIRFVGSVSTISDTWLWSWANPHLDTKITQDILGVRNFGETEDFANLTVPKWPAAEVDGWEMTSVAAKILDAQGAYRTPGDTGFTFMLLNDVRHVS